MVGHCSPFFSFILKRMHVLLLFLLFVCLLPISLDCSKEMELIMYQPYRLLLVMLENYKCHSIVFFIFSSYFQYTDIFGGSCNRDRF